jgi:hypothetical protein
MTKATHRFSRFCEHWSSNFDRDEFRGDDQYNAVGIATRHGLDGPGIET